MKMPKIFNKKEPEEVNVPAEEESEEKEGLFAGIPEPLTNRILAYIGFILLLVLMAVFFSTMLKANPYAIICCIGLAASIALFAVVEFLRFKKGNYKTLAGLCISSDIAGYRRQLRHIVIEDKRDNTRYSFDISSKKKDKIVTGDKVVLYIPSNLPLYQRNGAYAVTSYYAYELFP